MKLAAAFFRSKKNGAPVESPEVREKPKRLTEMPLEATLFHITHWKAASTWVARVLRHGFGKRNIMPRAYFDRDVSVQVTPNRIYPAACLMKEAFDALEVPANTRHFVLIRDLRDSIVSAYFSIRYSHAANAELKRDRRILESLDQEDGILYVIHTWAFASAAIQRSWLSAGESVIRFEDITQNPAENFRKIFVEHWGLTIDTALLDELLARHNFNHYSGGRELGEEDISSHYRKGAVGDWRLYFSEKTKAEFKRLFNDVLVLGGYERDDLW
jgi:hypothetical protein